MTSSSLVHHPDDFIPMRMLRRKEPINYAEYNAMDIDGNEEDGVEMMAIYTNHRNDNISNIGDGTVLKHGRPRKTDKTRVKGRPRKIDRTTSHPVTASTALSSSSSGDLVYTERDRPTKRGKSSSSTARIASGPTEDDEPAYIGISSNIRKRKAKPGNRRKKLLNNTRKNNLTNTSDAATTDDIEASSNATTITTE